MFSSSKPFTFGGSSSSTNQGPKVSDPFLQRLHKIRDSYNKDNPSFRFQAVVYNVKGQSMMSGSKPSSVSQEDWNQYVQSSPDPQKFEPSMLVNFSDLNSRVDKQAEAINLMREKLKDMLTRIDEVKADYNVKIKETLAKLTAQNNEINLSLIKFLQVEEVKALQSHPFSKEEHEIYDKLEELSQEVHKPNKYISALNTLDLNAKMMKDNFYKPPKITVPDRAIKPATEILKANSDALKALVRVIKKTYKTTDYLMGQLNH